MGCGSSKSTTTAEVERKRSGPVTSSQTESKRDMNKSLMSYSKTKGGSMLFNMTSSGMMGDEQTEFIDEQGIMSPSKADWKVGKAIKRAPDLKESVVIPISPNPLGEFGVRVEVGYKTLQGKNPRPPHKPNQDALSIFLVDGFPNLAVFSVFDGHGPFGEHASQFCRSRLHGAMVELGAEKLRNDPKGAFVEAIGNVHASFCAETTAKQGVDPLVSGTTCVAILFDGNTLHIANVGDSRAIMGIYNAATHQLVAEAITDDHKPQRPDERARLEKSSALLLTEKEVRGFGDDSKIYICREKGGDIVYGVLFTRSLGDLDAHNHLGVSAEPEMGERTLGQDDKYFVLASDGVWDYMTNEEVLEIVSGISDPLKASEKLVQVASTRWDERDADHRRDDITVIVMKTDLLTKVDKPAEENGGA